MTGTASFNAAALQLERTYCTKERDEMYIACEDYDFTWGREEMAEFRRFWREGMHLREIAVKLRRHINEVAILVIDQAEKGYIKPREGGAIGS